MRIGILGGTFNPVHNGHVYMAVEAIERLSLDRLIVIPNFIPPHKKAYRREPEDILAMLELAFKGIGKVEVSDYEIRREGFSYSYLTLEHFREAHPGDDLYFIIGEDSFIEFRTWKNPERILELSTLAVFERRLYPFEKRKEAEGFIRSAGHQAVFLDSLILEISSTDIRRRVKAGQEISFLVPCHVAAYIREKGLYLE